MLDLVVKSNFEIVECNFKELGTRLKSLIEEKYNIVVTEDSVKEAKKIRAEINKGKGALESAWRAKKKELESPIKELNEQAKEVFSLCDEAISKIDLQVAKFEEGKKRQAVALCEAYKREICEIKGIDPESINVSHFSNLSYVTEKGALSSAGKQAVDNLILEKIAEIAEQKQRELKAQMEVERIKQQAREEFIREQAQNQQKQVEEEKVEEQAQEAQGTQEKTQYEGIVFKINVELGIKTQGEYSESLRQKVQEWVKKEIEKNLSLSQALVKIEVLRA